MTQLDPLEDFARYYDAVMGEIDYDRWFAVTTTLAELVTATPLRHLDLACGTGRLMKHLVREGWNTIGLDRSAAMIRAGTKGDPAFRAVAGDMQAVPFRDAFDYATCLFDSLNFILDPEALDQAFREFAACLRDGGILYFDIITPRLVKLHFDGQNWIENGNGMTTAWESDCDWSTSIVETRIRVNQGPKAVVLERIHSLAEVTDALVRSGLHLLGTYDAETWGLPNRKTLRLDIVACKGEPARALPRLEYAADRLRTLLKR